MEFKTLTFKKLHPTFAAEVEGVDFSKPIPDDVFKEILAASAKVTPSTTVYICPITVTNMSSVWSDRLSQDWS